MTGHKILNLIVVALLALSAPINAESGKAGKPGDEFRKAAKDYEGHASIAIQEATHTQGEAIGRYLQLSAIYREMASIKNHAANLADQGRWDDINWQRYQELESKRDKLLGQVEWGYTKSNSGHKSSSVTKAKSKTKERGFLKAAREYQQQANEARTHAAKSDGRQRQLYQELAETYQGMADIKREAAAADQAGKDYDWGKYEKLSTRRDHIKREIKYAKK